MSTNRRIELVAIVSIVLALVGVVCAYAWRAGRTNTLASGHTMAYEQALFDTSRVHTIDIVMNDWDAFIEGCEDEEYARCAVVVDGESFKNVAIRAKGNTSLSSVSAMGSSRYSFKIEFDHYEDRATYHGLDKLSLNNIIQDNTYMKDYLTYYLMKGFGVDTPLASYVFITVNGQDWGLYLAVEGVEDSFLERNYGSDAGDLYKPDSMDMGGGRGNGRGFDMDAALEQLEQDEAEASANEPNGEMPVDTTDAPADAGASTGPDEAMASGNTMPMGLPPTDADISAPSDDASSERPQMPGGFSFPGGGGGGGSFMGSSDVRLQYIDDDPDSYASIFGNAKTTVTKADKTRLINALKKLSLGEDLESVLDTEEVLRYFVVHDFVCNGDSYTGTMVHNYYLHESNGRLSMIPWDYNLAFGGFTGGDASTLVNAPVDSPTSSGLGGMPAGMSWGSESSDSRPMVDWIFSNETYTARYHELYQEFLDSTDFATLIDTTKAMIADYVERDPTKFCTTEEFEKGVSALKEFCILRAQSVQGQLDGTIPSTEEGQRADSSSLVDASALTISDMGSMGMGGGPGNMPGNANDDASSGEPSEQGGGSFAPPDFGDFDPSGFAPGDFDPSGFAPGDFAPGGFDPSSPAPNGFDPTSQGGPSQGEANQQRPGRGDFEPGGFDPRSTDAATPGVNVQSLAILGASLAILALGFGATFIFRRP